MVVGRLSRSGECGIAETHGRGRGLVAGANQFLDLRIKADVELYFEEGELFIPPTFEQTPEEKKSGF